MHHCKNARDIGAPQANGDTSMKSVTAVLPRKWLRPAWRIGRQFLFGFAFTTLSYSVLFAATCPVNPLAATVSADVLANCAQGTSPDLKPFCSALAAYPSVDQSTANVALGELLSAIKEQSAAGGANTWSTVNDHLTKKIAAVPVPDASPGNEQRRGAAVRQIMILRQAQDTAIAVARESDLPPDDAGRQQLALDIRARLNEVLALQTRLLRLKAGYRAVLDLPEGEARNRLQLLFTGNAANLEEIAETQAGFLAQLRELSTRRKETCFAWTHAIVSRTGLRGSLFYWF
jgi:hypothetical protein